MIAERFHFYRRNQEAGESITEYVAELRRLSTHCEFLAGQLEEALRDRLVCRLRSEACQRRLLTKSDLTFQVAFKVAQSMEAADRNAQQLKGTASTIQLVAARLTSGASSMETRPCYRCSGNHDAAECRFKEVTCHSWEARAYFQGLPQQESRAVQEEIRRRY